MFRSFFEEVLVENSGIRSEKRDKGSKTLRIKGKCDNLALSLIPLGSSDRGGAAGEKEGNGQEARKGSGGRRHTNDIIKENML